MDRKSPRFRWFQTTVIDPRLLASLPSPSLQRVVRAPKLYLPPPPPAEMQYKIEVKAGSTPQTQRTWILPITLLQQHTIKLIKSSEVTSLTLPSRITPAAFQDFVDYMNSNIYSLNKNALDWHPILLHTRAWILGDVLGAIEFRNTALRSLHSLFEPLARKKSASRANEGAGVWQSPIAADDVKWVCENTSQDSVLRALFFDAVVAHSTQHEVLNFSSYGTNQLGTWTRIHTLDNRRQKHENRIWLSLSYDYPCFRARVESSGKVQDSMRGNMFRPVAEYIAGRLEMKEDEINLYPSRPLPLEPKPREKLTGLKRIGQSLKGKPKSEEDASSSSDSTLVVTEDEQTDDADVEIRGRTMKGRRSSSSGSERARSGTERTPSRPRGRESRSVSSASVLGSPVRLDGEGDSVYEGDDDDDYMMIDEA